MTRIRILSAILAGLPVVSTAEPLQIGNTLVLEGRAGLQASHLSGSDTQTLGATDLTLTWTGVAFGPMTLGAEATLTGVFNFTSGGDAQNLWAAGVLGFGATEVKFGAPRPVAEALSPMGDLMSNAALDLAYGRAMASGVSILSYDDNGMTPGLAVQGDTPGGIAWGASAHRIEGDGRKIDAVQAAASYTVGATTVFGSAEHLSGDTDAGDSVELGVLYDAGDWRLGLAAARPGAVVDGNVARLHVGYDITPALTLNSTYIHTEDGSLSSLDAEYRLPFGGHVRAGAAVSGGEEIYDLGIGIRF